MRLNSHYYNFRGVRCVRLECTCPASVRRDFELARLVDGGEDKSPAIDDSDREEGASLAGGAEAVPGGHVESSESGISLDGGEGGSSAMEADSLNGSGDGLTAERADSSKDGKGESSLHGADSLDGREGQASTPVDGSGAWPVPRRDDGVRI